MLQSSRTVLAFALIVSSGAAQAHDWYPVACCSEKDCRALVEAKGETVTEEADGWHLWDGRVVPRQTAKISPDRSYHLCESLSRSILCFFAPPGGS